MATLKCENISVLRNTLQLFSASFSSPTASQSTSPSLSPLDCMLSAVPSLLTLLDSSESALTIQRLTERYERLLDLVQMYSVRPTQTDLEKAKDTKEELLSALEEAENDHVTTLAELRRTKSLARALEVEAERRDKETEGVDEWECRRLRELCRC